MPEAQRETTISLGALSPPLTEQLAGLILSDQQRVAVEHLDQDARAVARLHVRGVIPGSAADAAHARIAKAVWKAVRRG